MVYSITDSALDIDGCFIGSISEAPRHVRIGNAQHLDKRLCRIDQVIRISSAYLVRRDGDDSTQGPLGWTDCAQSVDRHHLTDIQRQCDRFMACEELVINGSLRCKHDNIEMAEYVDIFYSCTPVNYDLLWTPGEIRGYINRILCPIGTSIVIRGTYYVTPRGDHSPDGAITDTDCVTPSDSKPSSIKCNGGISCDSLHIGTHALYCDDKLTDAKKFYLLYSCDPYINGKAPSLISCTDFCLIFV